MASITTNDNHTYNTFNKTFECGKVLQASDLNTINGNVNGILLYINENEEAWRKDETGEGGGDDLPVTPPLNGENGLSFYNCYAGFARQEDADTNYSQICDVASYPPSLKWSPSSNTTILNDEMLFMITAQCKGNAENPNNWQRYNGHIWQGPYRIGSSNTTSDTGADDDKYNYIYCRTDIDISSYDGSNHNWENIPEHIEDKLNYPSGVSDSITVSNDSSVSVTWTDHPCGVFEDNKYEWQVGFTVSDNTYTYAFGPICVSHWGHNGMDGDGVEYIFYLVGETYNNNSGDSVRNGEISSPETYFSSNLTYGKYRDPSTGEMSSYVGVNYSDLENDTNYQKDDFIPMGWHDEPYDVTLECYLQYVSIRKKNWVLNEKESKWGPFSPPRKWNNYSSATASGLTITLTNDNIFVDDDTSSDGLEYASKNMILIWNGTTDVTKPGTTYGKVEVSIDLNSDSGSLRTNLIPCRISSLDSNGDSVVINDGDKLTWGVFYPLPTGSAFDTFKEKGFCLTAVDLLNFNKNGTANEDDLREGMTAAVTYTAKLYTNNDDTTPVATVSRQLNLLVLNFSSGEAYSLMVSPNTLGISRATSSSNYTFRSGENLIKISANEANGKQVLQKALLTNKPSAGSKGLYIKVKERTSSGLSDVRTTEDSNNHIVFSGSNTTEITCTFTKGNSNNENFSFAAGDIQSFEIELWCVYDTSGNEIMVDTETVDFSIKGDDGTITDTSTLQPLILNEIYTIISNNDNGLVDDSTHLEPGLTRATENKILVWKGGSNVTDACTFKLVELHFPTSDGINMLKVQYRTGDTYSSNSNYLSTINDSINLQSVAETLSEIYFRLVNNTNFEKFPEATVYDYTLDIEHQGKKVGSKRFGLTVNDISSDGSFYKLIVEHDAVYYNSDGSIYSNAVPTIKVKKINDDGSDPTDVSFKILRNKSDESNLTSYDTNNLYVVLGSLYGSNSGYYSNFSGTSLPLSTTSNSGGSSVTTINIPYEINGYDLTLYEYDGTELVYREGPEHIDCIKHGSPGNSAFTSAVVKLYLRSSTTPKDINSSFENVYFDFSEGKLYNSLTGGTLIITKDNTTASNTETWYVTKPVGDQLLWMIAALAYGKPEDGRDTILYSDWDLPLNITESGDAEPNIDIVYLYQYNSTTPLTPSSTLYYKFSTEKLYTESSCNSQYESDITKDSDGYDGDENWSTHPSSRTDKDLWVTHAVATSTTDIETIPANRWSSPVIYVNKPQEVTAGKTGKMFYMMGVWDSTTEYKIDDLKIPVVFYNETLCYYYLNPKTEDKLKTSGKSDGISVEDIPNIKTFDTSNGNKDSNTDTTTTGHEYVWLEADDFGLVITEGIFSEFAKLGSAIISGDYMFSLNGKIDNNNYLNGLIYPQPNGSPSYTWFDSNLINIPTNLVENPKTITINRDNYNEKVDTGFNIYIPDKKFNPRVKITYDININTTVNFSVGTNSTSNIFIETNNNSNLDIYNCLSISLNNDTVYLRYSGLDCHLYVYLGSLPSNNVLITITKIEIVYSDFKPNWCVDLKTGKMIAGLGNFVVNSDGSVVAANGNFTISSSGNVNIKGNLTANSTITSTSITGGTISGTTMNLGNGNFVVDANGNISVNGLLSTKTVVINNSNENDYLKSDLNGGYYIDLSKELNISITYLSDNVKNSYILAPSFEGSEFTIINSTNNELHFYGSWIACNGNLLIAPTYDYVSTSNFLKLKSFGYMVYKVVDGNNYITTMCGVDSSNKTR